MPGLGLGLGLAEGLAMVAGLTDFIFTSTVVVFVLWWSEPCEPVLAGLPSPGLLATPPPDDTCSLRSVRVKDRGELKEMWQYKSRNVTKKTEFNHCAPIVLFYLC